MISDRGVTELRSKIIPVKEHKSQPQEWFTITKNSQNYRDILKNTVIKGDRIPSYECDTDHLDSQNLGPKYYTKINEKHVCLSDTYSLNNGRLAVVGYIFNESTKHWETKSYYRSNSQATWRFLPYYSTKEDGDVISHYSKGKNGEDSLNVPFIMQEKLAEIGKNPITNILHPEKLMASLSLDTDKHKQLIDTRNKHFEFNIVMKNKMNEFLPDSKKVTGQFEFYNNLYGKIKAKMLNSHNDKLKYLIFSSEKGQTWVGGVEYQYNNPLTNDGLYDKWVDPRGLTAPAMEYLAQAGQYANLNKRSGSYVEMNKKNIIIDSVVNKPLTSQRPSFGT